MINCYSHPITQIFVLIQNLKNIIFLSLFIKMCNTNSRDVFYICDSNTIEACNKLPKVRNRVS